MKTEIKKENRKKYFLITRCIIEAWCMMIVLIMNKGIITQNQLSSRKNVYQIYATTLAKLSASVSLDGILPIVLFIIFAVFYWQASKMRFHGNLWTHLSAFFFSAFTVVGYSMATTQSLEILTADYAQMVKAVICLIGYYGLFHPCIKFCYMVMHDKNIFGRSSRKLVPALEWIFDKHPWISAFLIFVLAWMPYLVSYYPGIFMGDTGAQISQFFQLTNGTSDYLNLLSENQLINNHHPVLHTILMGCAVKLGRMLGSDNLGIFFYTLFQYFCMAASLAAGIAYLKKIKVARWLQAVFLALIAFYPIFPRYAVLLSKDTLFSSFVLLFEIQLIQLIRGEITGRNWKKGFWFFLTMLAVMMLRQNGLYVILFSLPVLFVLKNKENRRRTAVLFAGALVVYLSYTNILFPALDITPGSKREMLSVPFQQTARYVKEYPKQVTEKEKKTIDTLLDYDRLADNYDPNISDPVKNTYNEDADTKELKNYFKVWFQMFWKHPGCYIEAYLNNYYGYFYMGNDGTDRRTRYYEEFSTKCMEKRINQKGFAFHHLERFEPVRKFLEMESELVLHMPMGAVFQASAFYTWLVIVGMGYLLSVKKYRQLVMYFPAVSIILVSMVSPVNGTIYFRYMLSVMFVVPVLLGATVENGKK